MNTLGFPPGFRTNAQALMLLLVVLAGLSGRTRIGAWERSAYEDYRRLPPVEGAADAVRPALTIRSEMPTAEGTQQANYSSDEERRAVPESILVPARLISPPVDPLEEHAEPSELAGAQHVSARWIDTDIREVLEIMSRTYRMNILVAPGVTGKVTASFEDVHPMTAFEGVLKLCNLTAQRDGDLLFVYSAANLPQTETHLRVFPLDYTTSEELLSVVRGLLSESGQAYASQVAPDNNRRTKEAIVVTDRQYNLDRVAEYIAQMDQAPRQVMIEAHVLEIALGNDQRHGVNLHALFDKYVNASMLMPMQANPTAPAGMFLRLDSTDVDTLIECLQTTTDSKTLASPRIMVVNGQKAHLQVGGRIGFKVITVTQTAAIEDVQFLDTGVVLEVTPHVTRDNRVLMRVKPKVASGEVNATTLLPESETREVETDVLVNDGHGVVLGGLIQEKDRAVRDKVPWLGDLWLIGKLFQRSHVLKERTEIVITLVPRIVPCGYSATERDVVDAERSQCPLFEGTLNRVHRPWEPRMPDPIDNPRHLYRW